MQCQPKNPLPPSPFHLLFACGLNSRNYVACPLSKPICLLSTHDPLTSTPARFFLYVGWVPLIWHSLPLLSPLRAQVGLLSTQFLLRCPSPLHVRVRFPRPNSHYPIHLLSVLGSSSSQLDSHSPFCVVGT